MTEDCEGSPVSTMCGNKMVSPQTIEAAYQLVLADAVKYFLFFLTILRCPFMADLAVYLKKTPMSSSVGWRQLPIPGHAKVTVCVWNPDTGRGREAAY